MNYLQMPCKRLETCLSANSKLCRKLFSLVPTMFDDNLRVTSAAYIATGFNTSCVVNLIISQLSWDIELFHITFYNIKYNLENRIIIFYWYMWEIQNSLFDFSDDKKKK